MDAGNCAPLTPGMRVGDWRITGVLERTPYLCRYQAEDGQRGAVLQELLPESLVLRGVDGVQARDPEDRNTWRWWLRSHLDRANAFMSLASPGLARVLDAFEANGTSYVALEAVPGETLADAVRMRGALDWRVYLPALRPLVEALHQAHAQNLVVRDITPSQIVLRDGRAAVLAGFGPLRAPVRFRAQTVTSTTQAAYAAPEELSAVGSIGAWTDAYALGASSAYALYGRIPPEATQRNAAPLTFSLTDALPPGARSALEGLLLPEPSSRTALPDLLRVLPSAGARAPASPTSRLAVGAIAALVVVGVTLALWLRSPPTPTELPAPAAPATTAVETLAAAAAPTPAAPAPAAASTSSAGELALKFGNDEPEPVATEAARPAAKPATVAPPTAKPALAAARPSVSATEDAFAEPSAPLAVTITTPTLNIGNDAKPVVDEAARAQRAAAHLAALQTEKRMCRSHVSDLVGNGTVTYADLAAMKGVDKLSGGRLQLRHVATDDGRSVTLLVDTHGCVSSVRVE